MKVNVKGTRKINYDTGTGISAGKLSFKSPLVISMLVGAIYAVFLVEATISGGITALMLSVFSSALFIILLQLTRGSTVKDAARYRSLIMVFLGLSILSLIWQALSFFNVMDGAGIDMITLPAVVGSLFAIVSTALFAAIMYVEKGSLEKTFVRIGDYKAVAIGAGCFVICTAVAVGAILFLFNGAALGGDRLMLLTASVMAFGILAGAYEEVWFRGLLLSRITPLAGVSHGTVYQALVFGVFESVTFYILTGEVVFIPVIFILGAMSGFYWGKATLKFNSLAPSALLHAGLYVLITLPILVGIMT